MRVSYLNNVSMGSSVGTDYYHSMYISKDWHTEFKIKTTLLYYEPPYIHKTNGSSFSLVGDKNIFTYLFF